jgi:uncharacterized protein with von Willebrand factor type A (vWA) domain
MGGSDVVGGLVLQLTSGLRRAGVPVSTGEAMDAASALEAMDLSTLTQVRAALRATLIKRQNDIETFERTFDALMRGSVALMAPSVPPGASSAGNQPPPPGAGASTQLLEELLAALQTDDAAALSVLAAQAVEQLAGIGAGARDSERAFLYRVLRGLDLASLLQQAMRNHVPGADESEVERALGAGELEARAEEFRRLLAVEIRSRLGERAGDQARRASPVDPMDIPILTATARELEVMRGALRPLARRLAVRGRRKSRLTHRGRLDVRRTIRRSLSTGGLPLQPMWRRPKATRPELVIVCDVSGSVAEFARFTLALMSAMSAEFSALRCFAFVDGIDEVTRIVVDAGGVLTPGHILARTNVVWRDGHSDFGRVVEQLAVRFPDALTPRSTLLITGDARNNYRSPNAGGFEDIARRVREVHWLNPEPRQRWGSGDSAMDMYSRECTSVHEVRTLRQLELAVARIEDLS